MTHAVSPLSSSSAASDNRGNRQMANVRITTRNTVGFDLAIIRLSFPGVVPLSTGLQGDRVKENYKFYLTEVGPTPPCLWVKGRTPMSRHSAPGKSSRKGITLLELGQIFPDEQTATVWLERYVWSDGRCCGHRGSLDTRPVPHATPMPYWCTDCRSYFSVRTGAPSWNDRMSRCGSGPLRCLSNSRA